MSDERNLVVLEVDPGSEWDPGITVKAYGPYNREEAERVKAMRKQRYNDIRIQPLERPTVGYVLEM